LAELLDSPPDRHSPLPGAQLIRARCAHLIVMGGDYPAGKEHNFAARGSSPFTGRVLPHWPTPILYSGSTLVKAIMTGPSLASLPAKHPVHVAYAMHNSQPLTHGRPSWDQTAILAAIRSPSRWWTLSSPGHNDISPDGSNHWRDDLTSQHAYLI